MEGGHAGAGAGAGAGVRVSVFDESVENHFSAMETISKMCGDEAEVALSPDDSYLQRLSSSTRFLREWRQFEYQPRKVKFSSGVGGSEGKCVTGEVILPQFSSATVPKVEDGLSGASTTSRDFVLYVGGSVWALDWCPRVHPEPHHPVKCEFVAVAVHPPDSYYHKIGAPLIGRGMIQIWCILNINDNAEGSATVRKMRQPVQSTKEPGRPRGRPRKKTEESTDEGAVKRPRGRPRKKPSGNFSDSSGCIEQPSAVKNPECSAQALALDGIPENTQESTNESNYRNKRKSLVGPTSGSIAAVKTLKESKLEEVNEAKSLNNILSNNSIYVSSSPDNHPIFEDSEQDLGAVKKPKIRLRKKAVDASPERLDCTKLNVQCLESSSELLMLEGTPESTQECGDQSNNRKRRKTSLEATSNSAPKIPSRSSSKKNESKYDSSATSTENRAKSTSPLNHQTNKNSEQDNVATLCVQTLAVNHPEGSPQLLALEETEENQGCARQLSTTKEREGSTAETSTNLALKTSEKRRSRRGIATKSACDSTCPQNEYECTYPVNCQISNNSEHGPLTDQSGPSLDALPIRNVNKGPFTMGIQIEESNDQDHMVTNYASDNLPFGKSSASCSLPDDVTLPRVVFCLAHNGKVVWDMKWRLQKISNSCCLYQMGYLAVLLGNGSLEVWDVPLPLAMKQIYYALPEEGTDPRFVKLEPVFKCSYIKCGETQSIPLTVEWSTQDFLLVGCHDGTVALWKFCPTSASAAEDTRPLLCFSADTLPIRAVAWAPVERDQETANIILTAGHIGLKFWDLRDPFRPLWDLHPAPKFIYSLDWLPDPKCIMLSFDDGTMRLLSLAKAVYDAPVNGNPTVGPKQHGLHILNCSSFAIWSVQVSRLTGMIAYCSADGTVNRFQLTSKAVEKEPARHRAPHFLCGFLSEEESAIMVNSPLPVSPLAWKKPVNNIGNEIPRPTLSKPSRSKTTNSAKPKGSPGDPPLAMCYGDDPGVHPTPDETLASMRKERKSKPRSSLGKDDGMDQALVLVGEEQDSLPEKVSDKNVTAERTETMPPKMVAMHRVRWNMNRGSERWLCSGGAAGIVRCQEIIMTEFDTYLAKKR